MLYIVFQEVEGGVCVLRRISRLFFYLMISEIKIAPCGGGLEYPHRSPASLRRRRKGNLVPGGITGPPRHWET
jgi:hypothetical protein